MEDLDNDLNTDTDLSSDESVIETIEQHKRLENGKLKFKIKYSSGNDQWAMENLLEKDVPEMVKEYKIKNSLEGETEDIVHAIPTSMSEEIDVVIEGEDETGVCLTPLKRKRTGNRDDIVDVLTVHSPKGKEVLVKTNKKKCMIDHDIYEIGTTYKEETNAQYWNEGESLFGVNCNVCKQSFQSSKIKPSCTKPAYVCINRCCNDIYCKTTICHECFKEKQLEAINEDDKKTKHFRQTRMRVKKLN